MNLLKLLKKFLFIQNIFASFVSIIPTYLEFTVGKYLAIKKQCSLPRMTKHLDRTLNLSFYGSSFNFAMKINKKIEKIFGKSQCDFIGFDLQGFWKSKR